MKRVLLRWIIFGIGNTWQKNKSCLRPPIAIKRPLGEGHYCRCLVVDGCYQVYPPQKASITHNTCHFPLFPKGKVNLDVNKITLQRNNMSHLGKRKIIDSKVPFLRAYVSSYRRVPVSFSSINLKAVESPAKMPGFRDKYLKPMTT